MRSRRGRRRRDERRKQAGIIALAIAIGTLAGLSISPNLLSRHAADVQSPAAHPLTPARTLLALHQQKNGSVDLLALIGVERGGYHTALVFLPPPTVVDVPSLDLQKFGDVARLASVKLLRLAVMNALGVRIDDVVALNDAALARMLAPAKHLTVTFDAGVRIDDAAGSLSYAGGANRLLTEDAQRVLLGTESGGTIAHLVTVEAVLEAWLEALDRPGVARRTAAVAPGALSLIKLRSSIVRFETLPVETVDAGGEERFQLREADVDALVHRDFGFALLGGGGRRPRVEILNGVGSVGLTPRIAALLVPKGADVQLTTNVPGFGVRTTRVVYYRDRDESAARLFARQLGVTHVAKGDTPISVVDVTVVIGADVASRYAR